MSADPNWNETKVLLHEVESLFTREDDVRDINEIKKMANDIRERQEMNEKGAKELIKKMTATIASKELDIMAPNGSTHAGNLEKYVRDKENVSNNVDKLRQAVDKKRENIAAMATEGLALKEKAAGFANTDEIGDPGTAYALSLLQKISNIAWDYKNCSRSVGDNLPSQLCGTIGNEAKSEFKRIQVDTRSMTSYDLAEKLWADIEDGWSP